MSSGSARGALLGGVLRHLDAPGLACTVVFAARPAGGDGGDPVELSYMDVDRDSVDGIVSACRDFVEHRAGWAETRLDLDTDNEIPREEYHVAARADVPSIGAHTAMARRQIENLDPGFVAMLQSLQVRLQTRARTVVFFRRFTKGKVLTQGKKIWRLTEGRLRVSRDTLIELPGDYDCCLYGDDLAVFHRPHFEDIFGYHEHHLSLHGEVFAGLEKSNVNIDRFAELLEQTRGDKRKLRKFGSIRDKGMYKWDFAKINGFLKKRNITTVRADPATRTVEFDNAQAMLDFYNDAHLDSKATGRKYRAQSKSRE